MRNTKWILLAIVMLIVNISMTAQTLSFKCLSASDGLAGSQVNSICKDSRGFVWIGTSSGLTRFDGVTMRSYKANFSHSSELPDSYIESVQEDESGNLWIKSGDSYVVMDPNTEVFDRSISQRLSMLASNLEPEIIYVDHNKNLWVYIRNEILYYYKVRQQLVYSFPQNGDNPLLPTGLVTGITDTPQGVALVYQNGLVVSLDAESQRVLWQNNVLAKNSVTYDSYKVFCDKINDLWVYGRFSTYFYDSQNHTWLRSLQEVTNSLNSAAQVGNNLAVDIKQDSKGRVWIATDRSGLLMMDPQKRTMIQQTSSSTSNSRSLSSNYLQSVYVDDLDVVWLGTQRSGLCYWAPSLFLFQTNDLGDVNGIAQDTNGNLWMATRDKGLIYMNPTDPESIKYYTTQNGLCDNVFSSVVASLDGSIWVGSSRNGISRLRGGNVTNISYIPGQDGGLKDNCVQALTTDSHGSLWIGTHQGGLQCLNPTSGTFANFNVENGKLPSNDVTCLNLKKNHLIVGTANGLSILNLSTNQIQNYNGNSSGSHHFTNNSISQVLVDSRGLIWIGTRDGLNVLNLDRDELTTFTVSDNGLPSDVICGLAESHDKSIYVTTNNGMSRITISKDTSTGTSYIYSLQNYDVRDGLQGSEFNPGAILATNNNLFMGGLNGISWTANNANRKLSKHKLSIILSGLKIDGQPAELNTEVNDHRVLSHILNDTKTISLRHNERSISMILNVNDYGHADHPNFTYKIDGMNDDNWLPIESDGHTLLLRYLSTGKHVVHIRASLDGGKTLSEERVITIKVLPPWWFSWWTLSFVLVLILVLAFLYGKFVPRLKDIFRRRHQEIYEYRLEKEKLTSLASDMRQNVVTMIPTLGLLQLNANGQDKETLTAMQHSARQLLEKLNSLRESDNLILHDAGMDSDMIVGDESTETTSTKSDEEVLLFSDEGVVQGNVVLTDEGVVESPTLKYTLYLIDTDSDMLEFMEDCLKGTYQIETFTTADSAWNAILEGKPSVIMCAQNLDTMSGSDLCHKVKNEHSMERLPFILMTDSLISNADFIQKNITLMADDYIPQPMNLKTAIVRINKLLNVSVSNVDANVNDDTMRGADSMQLSSKLVLRQQVTDYVKQNISRKNLSLVDLSSVMGISNTLLFRKVENVTGRVPADFIRAVRLQEAAELLISGSVSVSEVADELGFASTESFSYYFNLEYGMLPSEYIRQMNEMNG